MQEELVHFMVAPLFLGIKKAAQKQATGFTQALLHADNGYYTTARQKMQGMI
jgi:hypothetical protein